MVHFQSWLGISEVLCPPSNSPTPFLPPGNTCFFHKSAFPREFIGVESYPAFCLGSCFFQLIFSGLFTLGEMAPLIKVSSSRPDYLRLTQGTFCPPPVCHDTSKSFSKPHRTSLQLNIAWLCGLFLKSLSEIFIRYNLFVFETASHYVTLDGLGLPV